MSPSVHLCPVVGASWPPSLQLWPLKLTFCKLQGSLLALLLATQFFHEPLVSLVCGISTIVMSLGGFGLVVLWKEADKRALALSNEGPQGTLQLA